MRIRPIKIKPEELRQALKGNPLQPCILCGALTGGRVLYQPPPGERNQVFVYSLCGNHSPTSSGGREDIPKVPRFQRVGIWP